MSRNMTGAISFRRLTMAKSLSDGVVGAVTQTADGFDQRGRSCAC